MPAKTATIKDPVLQEQTRLVRTVEANLKVTTQDPVELRFRSSLIRKTIADLPKLNSSLIGRLYTAVCEIEFASEEIVTLRMQLQVALGNQLGLAAFKAPKA